MTDKQEQDTAAISSLVGIELTGVAEQLADNAGFWHSCSGCHNLNEGHPTGEYSAILKCHLGMGCRECGGIGAVWDNTDYSNYGKEEPAPRVRPDLSWLSSMTFDDLRDAVAFLTVEQREALRKFIWSETVSGSAPAPQPKPV